MKLNTGMDILAGVEGLGAGASQEAAKKAADAAKKKTQQQAADNSDTGYSPYRDAFNIRQGKDKIMTGDPITERGLQPGEAVS